MTQEEFIEELNKRKYSHKIKGGKLIVTHMGNVSIEEIDGLPENIEFRNFGFVTLYVTTTPKGVEFNNSGSVHLNSLVSFSPGLVFGNNKDVFLNKIKELVPGVEFKNRAGVFIPLLESISPSVEFKNSGPIVFKKLGINTWGWSLRINNIDDKRLLNLMIKRGILS